MSAPVIQYATQSGDRWDLLAWRFYGDATRYHDLIAANPAVAIMPVLSTGLTLRVPVLPSTVESPATAPAWIIQAGGA